MKKIFIVFVLVFVGIVINEFKGNPISYFLAKQQVHKYLDNEYELKDINYSMKDHYYYAHIQVPKSMDRYFQVALNYKGEEIYHTIDDIDNKSNTAKRLNEEYRQYIDELIESSSFPYKSNIAFGELDIRMKDQDLPPYYIPQESLMIDKVYNIDDLGKEAGHIILYLDNQVLTDENCHQLLCQIKDVFDYHHKSFKSIDIVLRNKDDEYALRYFPYDDIGNLDRVKQVRQDTIEYYAIQDKLKLS